MAGGRTGNNEASLVRHVEWYNLQVIFVGKLAYFVDNKQVSHFEEYNCPDRLVASLICFVGNC